MDLIIDVNDQTYGRDRIAKFIQFTSRIVWHQMKLRNANKYNVDRIRNLELTINSFRKILRMGRCVEVFYTALDSMQIEDPVVRYTLSASRIADALYMYCDHVVWLSRHGFVKSDANSWDITSDKFWLLAVIMNLVRDFYEIYHILQLNKSNSFLRPSELVGGNRKVFEISVYLKYLFLLVNNHRDVFVDLLKNTCDLFIPLASLGYMDISPSSVGFFGAMSAISGFITVVHPMARLIPS